MAKFFRSSKGYTLQALAANFSPADATTYYFGMSQSTPGSASGFSRIYIPKAGTVKSIYAFFANGSANGSNETSSLSFRLNNVTDTLISSLVANDLSQALFSNLNLSIPVIAGDYFEFKWVTPAWVTNPTGVRISVSINIE